MKTLDWINLLTCFCLTLPLIPKAQTSISQFQTRYLQVTQYSNKSPKVDTGILVTTAAESVYKIVKKPPAGEKVEELPNGDLKFKIDLSDEISFKTYFNAITGKRVTRDAIFIREYLVVEDRDSIHWKIGNTTKLIGGLKAQSAYGSYKGRNYTAWFAPAIPLPFGPWKLW
ncbi:MAG: GLPGLI family protein, partial [Bacteroidetes bacterium]